jgi:hypothetical protein
MAVLAGPNQPVMNAKVAANPLGEDKPSLPVQPSRLVDLAVCFARQDEWFLQPVQLIPFQTRPGFGKSAEGSLKTQQASFVVTNRSQTPVSRPGAFASGRRIT